MPQKNRVLNSINNEDESRCVDIFLRADGTFGFEEYRRDFEDNRGWFPVGYFANQIFSSEGEATSDAVVKVAWLRARLDRKRNHKA